MTNELPPLPPPEARLDASQPGKKRGRPWRRNSLLPASSSDPAVFSSDDDPALDNYIPGRRKRRYVGTWFNQNPASSDSAFGDDVQPTPRRAPRQFTRQLDSGIWMSLDGNDDNDNNDIEIELAVSRLPQPHHSPPRPSQNSKKPTMSAAEAYAKRVIERCISDGDETIDIS